MQEVKRLNEACCREVQELEKQLLNLVKEKKLTMERIAAAAAAHREGYGGPIRAVGSDHELQTLSKEQRSIEHRSAALCCIIYPFILLGPPHN